MKKLIDNYKGTYNSISYSWNDRGEIAEMTFLYKGKKVVKKLGQLSGNPIEEEYIKMISEMVIDSCLERFKEEDRMTEILEKIK